jgi:hypothetical protein
MSLKRFKELYNILGTLQSMEKILQASMKKAAKENMTEYISKTRTRIKKIKNLVNRIIFRLENI